MRQLPKTAADMYRTAVFLRLASNCLCSSAAQGFLLYRKLAFMELEAAKGA